MEVSRYINATDEQWIPYYQNGKIRGRVTYRHSNYADTIWNSDHTKVEYSTTFDSKYKIDTVFEYSDSGFIYTMQIIDGKCPDTLCCCDGIHLEFESGKLSQRYHMKSRNTDGLHEYFYPNGRLRYEVYLVDGDANGPSKTYFENGHPESEGSYQNCKKEGQWWYWSANGSWRIVNYFRDSLNGVTTEYNTSGPNLWVKGQYKDGKEIGRWYSYDKDTILKSHHDY
jgi:antitoxin component YwqK of YwqJK toxin-antitoxin module